MCSSEVGSLLCIIWEMDGGVSLSNSPTRISAGSFMVGSEEVVSVRPASARRVPQIPIGEADPIISLMNWTISTRFSKLSDVKTAFQKVSANAFTPSRLTTFIVEERLSFPSFVSASEEVSHNMRAWNLSGDRWPHQE